MQPPETDPTTAPSSHKAMMEPTGRGDEPQVRTTVASSACFPATRQSRKVRSTITSRFSMSVRCAEAACPSLAQLEEQAVQAHADHHAPGHADEHAA